MDIFLEILFKYKWIIFGVVLMATIAAEAVYIKILKDDESVLVSQKSELNTKLVESQANVVQLKNDINDQNLAINRLKSDADQRLAQHAADIVAAQKAANNLVQQAADLLKKTAPQNVSKCDAANQLINMELGK